MRREESLSPATPLTTWFRYALVAVAWLLALAGVVQVFLAGLALFDDLKYWDDHKDFGNMIGILAVLLPILALLGRLGVPITGQAIVVLILYIIQILLPRMDTGWIAALHPVNAFFLIGAAGSLGTRTLAVIRPQDRGPTATARTEAPYEGRAVP